MANHEKMTVKDQQDKNKVHKPSLQIPKVPKTFLRHNATTVIVIAIIFVLCVY